MFCPNCKYEYHLGVTRCPDCDVDLVYALPPKSHQPPREKETPSGYVPVYTTSSLPNIAIAGSILKDADIDFISRRDPLAGPGFMTISVNPENAEEARTLLERLVE